MYVIIGKENNAMIFLNATNFFPFLEKTLENQWIWIYVGINYDDHKVFLALSTKTKYFSFCTIISGNLNSLLVSEKENQLAVGIGLNYGDATVCKCLIRSFKYYNSMVFDNYLSVLRLMTKEIGIFIFFVKIEKAFEDPLVILSLPSFQNVGVVEGNYTLFTCEIGSKSNIISDVIK